MVRGAGGSSGGNQPESKPDMTISDPRTTATESIEGAIAYLAEALVELDRIPVHDRATIGYVMHAMNNCLSVADATLSLMRQSPSTSHDPQMIAWVDGLRHVTNLMHITVGRLARGAPAQEFQLKFDYINLPRLMERACDYHRRSASGKSLSITCRTIGAVPNVWADAVAVAIIADNLLSNAVQHSHPGDEVLVQISPAPGGVVCSVRDYGPVLNEAEQGRQFERGAGSEPEPGDDDRLTGFGLTIAKHFIDRMSGRLWSETNLERGACFSFRLPYHADGTPAPPASPDRPGGTPGGDK
jgi:signal transduction histidine kinase